MVQALAPPLVLLVPGPVSPPPPAVQHSTAAAPVAAAGQAAPAHTAWRLQVVLGCRLALLALKQRELTS